MDNTKMSPRLPPTPKPSTELGPRRTSRLSIDSNFNIGPAAITFSPDALKLSAEVAAALGQVQAQPISPTSPFTLTAVNIGESKPQKRKASSSSAGPASKRKDVFIGPPPTRQHPIIQMKPRETIGVEEQTSAKAGLGPKKKTSGVSAAKRKIARKTAHSEIERRRRSKMNDQFAKLKSMVPACKNQDMHKLAILEATTEYLAYLEEAIKVYRSADQGCVVNSPPTSLSADNGATDDFDDNMSEDSEPEDEIMDSSESSPILEPTNHQRSVLEITDTEATHALLLLADHSGQISPHQRSIDYFRSKPMSVKDLLL